MTTFEIVKKLAQSRGITLKQLSENLGFGESTIYKWNKQTPKTEYLKLVADYFNVSIDYLLGRTDNPSTLNDEPSMTKQVMMRMDTNGLSDNEIEEIESEMERFFAWRIEEIKREREE